MFHRRNLFRLIAPCMSVLLFAAASEAGEGKLESDAEHTRMVIGLDRQVEFRVYSLAEPDRIVVELPDAAIELPSTPPDGSPVGFIKSFRSGESGPGWSRIVVDLTAPAKVQKARLEPSADGKSFRLALDIVPSSAVTAKVTATPIEQDRWVKIGAQVVKLPSVGTSIATLDHIAAKAVRVESPDSNILLKAVVVNYSTGRVYLEERPINLLAGERTRAIGTLSTGAGVKSVDLVIDPKAGGDTATVEVWALATPVRREVDSGAPVRSILLGTEKLEGNDWLENYKIAVDQVSGFDQLTFGSKNLDVAVKSVRVKYKDGGAEDLSFGGEKIPKGQTRTVWLGSDRPIDNVEVSLDAPGGPRSRSATASKSASLEISGEDLDLKNPNRKWLDQPVAAQFSDLNPGAEPAIEKCIRDKTCTAVPVFFGTNRNQTRACRQLM